MERFLNSLLKLLVILLLAPLAICIALKFALAVIETVLPWFVALVLLATISAGATAGIILVRRGSRRHGSVSAPFLGPVTDYRVRRPKGGSWR